MISTGLNLASPSFPINLDLVSDMIKMIPRIFCKIEWTLYLLFRRSDQRSTANAECYSESMNLRDLIRYVSSTFIPPIGRCAMQAVGSGRRSWQLAVVPSGRDIAPGREGYVICYLLDRVVRHAKVGIPRARQDHVRDWHATSA